MPVPHLSNNGWHGSVLGPPQLLCWGDCSWRKANPRCLFKDIGAKSLCSLRASGRKNLVRACPGLSVRFCRRDVGGTCSWPDAQEGWPGCWQTESRSSPGTVTNPRLPGATRSCCPGTEGWVVSERVRACQSVSAQVRAAPRQDDPGPRRPQSRPHRAGGWGGRTQGQPGATAKWASCSCPHVCPHLSFTLMSEVPLTTGVQPMGDGH